MRKPYKTYYSRFKKQVLNSPHRITVVAFIVVEIDIAIAIDAKVVGIVAIVTYRVEVAVVTNIVDIGAIIYVT